MIKRLYELTLILLLIPPVAKAADEAIRAKAEAEYFINAEPRLILSLKRYRLNFKPAMGVYLASEHAIYFSEIQTDGCNGRDVWAVRLLASGELEPPKRVKKVECVLALAGSEKGISISYQDHGRQNLATLKTTEITNPYALQIALKPQELMKLDRWENWPGRPFQFSAGGILATQASERNRSLVAHHESSSKAYYFDLDLSNATKEQFPQHAILEWETDLSHKRSLFFGFDGPNSNLLYGVHNGDSDGMSRIAVWQLDPTHKAPPKLISDLGREIPPFTDALGPWSEIRTQDWSGRNLSKVALGKFGIFFGDSTGAGNEWDIVAYYSPHLPLIYRLQKLSANRITGLSFTFPDGLLITNGEDDEFLFMGPNPPQGWPSLTADGSKKRTKAEYQDEKSKKEQD